MYVYPLTDTLSCIYIVHMYTQRKREKKRGGMEVGEARRKHWLLWNYRWL